MSNPGIQADATDAQSLGSYVKLRAGKEAETESHE